MCCLLYRVTDAFAFVAVVVFVDGWASHRRLPPSLGPPTSGRAILYAGRAGAVQSQNPASTPYYVHNKTRHFPRP